MPTLSNLPPGVTNRMIEEQAGMNTPRKRATYARNQTAASRIEEQTAMTPNPLAQPMTDADTKLMEKIADLVYRTKIDPARDSHNSMAVARRIMAWMQTRDAAARQSWEVERAQLRKDCADWAQRFQDADAAKDDLLEAASSAAAKVRGLFDASAHGNQQHRDWLKQAIDDHFAGREVKAPVTDTPTPPGSPARAAELADYPRKVALVYIESVKAMTAEDWSVATADELKMAEIARIMAEALLATPDAAALSRAPGEAADMASVCTRHAAAMHSAAYKPGWTIDAKIFLECAAGHLEAQSLALAQRDAEVAEYWTLYRNANARAEAAEASVVRLDAEVARLRNREYERELLATIARQSASEERLRTALEKLALVGILNSHCQICDGNAPEDNPYEPVVHTPDCALTPTASGAAPVDGGKTKPKSQGWNPGHGI